jgi:hypothetical protein
MPLTQKWFLVNSQKVFSKDEQFDFLTFHGKLSRSKQKGKLLFDMNFSMPSVVAQLSAKQVVMGLPSLCDR